MIVNTQEIQIWGRYWLVLATEAPAMIPAGAATKVAPSKRTPERMGDAPLHAFTSDIPLSSTSSICKEKED